MGRRRFTITIVDRNSKLPLAGVRVEAFDLEHLLAEPIVAADTDMDGAASLSVDDGTLVRLFGSTLPTLAFRAVRAGRLLASTKKTLQWTPTRDGAGRLEVVEAGDLGPAPPTKYVIEGRYVDPAGANVGGAPITVVSENVVDGRVARATLGTTKTDPRGRFAIVYDTRAGDGAAAGLAADVTVFVGSPDSNPAASPASVHVCRAEARAHVTLVKGNAADPGPTTFATLLDSVAGLHTPPAALIGDLANTAACVTGRARAEIDALAAAHTMAAAHRTAHATPEVFYGLIRAGLPQTVEELYTHSLPRMRRALLASVATRAVSTQIKNDIEATMADLETVGVSVLSGPVPSGLSVGVLVAHIPPAFVDETTRTAFIRRVLNNDGNGAAFWAELAADPAFDATARDWLQYVVGSASLVAAHEPMITSLVKDRQAGTFSQVSDLAKRTEADWLNAINASADPKVPEDIPGVTPDEKARNYAALIAANVEAQFRTRVIARQVQLEAPGTPVAAFFADPAHAAFDFATTRVGAYAAKNNLPAPTVARLQGLERLYKLTSNYAEMKALDVNGFQSAAAIHAAGKPQFMKKMTGGGPSTVEPGIALTIFANACWANSAAVQIQSMYGAQFSKIALPVLPDPTPSTTQTAVPDWTTLFGSQDACACDPCQSVFGPSAYLVDLLDFLDRQSARNALLARRPDLKYLLLSCASAETALPYVDLALEIMEVRAALPGPQPQSWPGGAIDTVETTDELLAEPDVPGPYRAQRLTCYSNLAAAVFPFSVPFHLWNEEARTYLNYLGVPRQDLIYALAQDAMAQSVSFAVAPETLGLAPRDWELLSGASSAAARDLWGYPPSSATWKTELASVPEFLARTELTFDDVRELTATAFAASVGITLVGDSACDVSKMRLVGPGQPLPSDLSTVADAQLVNLALFLRLVRKLGWSITDTDKVFGYFGSFSTALLTAAANLKMLEARLGLSGPGLLALWMDVDHRPSAWTSSLYERVFLNRRVVNPPDADFLSLFNGAPLASTVTIGAKRSAIQAALRAVDRDIRLLVDADAVGAELALKPDVPASTSLSIPSLSALFRVVTFARALGISVKDYLVLRALSNAHPLTELEALPRPPQPPDALAFARSVDRLKESGADVAEIHYVLRDVAAPETNLRPDESTVTTWVNAVETVVTKAAENANTLTDASGERTESLLKALGSGDLDASAVVALLDGSNTANASALVATYIAPYCESPLQDFPGATAANLLVLGGAHYLATDRDRFNFVVKRLARRVDSIDAVKKFVSATFGIDQASAASLLSSGALSWNGQPAIFAFVPQDDPTNPPKAADRRSLLLRLYKASLVVKRFGMTSREVGTLFRAVAGATQPHLALDSLPIERPTPADSLTAAQAGFAAWTGLVDYARLRNGWRGGTDSLLDVFATALTLPEVGPADSLFDAIAAGTGWSRSDVAVLTSQFGYTAGAFRDHVALLRMSDALALTMRMGAPASTAIGWTDLGLKLPPALAPNAETVANEIKQIAKANHTDDEWAAIARPLRDVLRERQRKTLVSVLLHKLALATPDLLYENLLLDVEMTPATLTSRTVLAHGTIQLLVQRALLNLESTFVPTTDAAEEWQWMKYYRVWEANRRVFCYPENWISPELRDDKTPLFRAFETKLLSAPLTTDSAESAYRDYLEGLSQLASLQVVAMYTETPDAGVSTCQKVAPIVHVVGRTANPQKYFYRRREQERWSAWESIDADINSEHIVLYVLAGRLFVLWAVLEDRASSFGDSNQPDETLVRMLFAVRRNGQWSGPRDTAIASPGDLSMVVEPSNLSLVVEPADTTFSIGCYVFISTPFFSTQLRFGGFNFDPETESLLPYFDPNAAADAFDLPRRQVTELGNVRPFYQRFRSGGFPDLAVQMRIGNQLKPATLLNAIMPYDLLVSQAGDVRDEEPFLIFGYEDSGPSYFLSESTHTYSKALQPPFPVQGKSSHGKPPPKPKAKTFSEPVYHFELFHHPYVSTFRRELYLYGLDGLLRWTRQTSPLQLKSDLSGLETHMTGYVDKPFPLEEVDFRNGSAFGVYNWELFFHAPFFIAKRLSAEGNFEAANRWFHYVFDPTDGTPAPGDSPSQRYWKVKPLYYNKNLASIQAELAAPPPGTPAEQLQALTDPTATSAQSELAAEIAAWTRAPFNPDAIARLRLVAYQKAVVKAYIENLIAWGDQLFTLDTLESINEATQLYVLAASLLGPRPRLVPPTTTPTPKTYDELGASPVLQQMESLVPAFGGDVCCGSNPSSPYGVFRTDYFCVPPNDMLIGLWDTVADRLFKIRHGQNIAGVAQTLPLFEPPIDPELLIRARAAGIDVSSVLNDINVAAPAYRYSVLYSRATEFCASVIALGNSLLSALEKGDAEHLASLRAHHEVVTQTAQLNIRKNELDEANSNLTALQLSRAVTQIRFDFYDQIIKDGVSDSEQTAFDDSSAAARLTVSANEHHMGAAVCYAVPDFSAGLAACVTTGGQSIGKVVDAVASGFTADASRHAHTAQDATTHAVWQRRAADWGLQKSLADAELKQIDQQITGAQLRVAIASQQLSLAQAQVDQAKEVESFLRDKFTNEELYTWMWTQTTSIYFEAYQLAYELAKRAEKAFQYERGDVTQTFIEGGYWDSFRQGVLAGERLALALRRLDAAYLQQNTRELELTKQVSLLKLDPIQLLTLRETGAATISLREQDYDRDHPTHYLRRLKTVAVTVQCVAGPYQGVHGTLTLLKGETLRGPSDINYTTSRGVIQSIATSQAQNDSGLFELNFRDDRLLPFEGVGAHVKAGPQWRFELSAGNEFDYTSIDDLILHVRYTARDGRARGSIAGPRKLMIRLRAEFADAWEAYRSGAADDLQAVVPLSRFTRGNGETLGAGCITAVRVFAAGWPPVPPPSAPTLSFAVTAPTGTVQMQGSGILGSLVESDSTATTLDPSDSVAWHLSPQVGNAKLTNDQRLTLTDVWILFEYTTRVRGP